ncbi:hypothetical protein D9M72_455850 [compost metagenome]
MDDHGGRLQRPGHEEYRIRVGTADHVDIGFVQQVVIDVVVDEITGDRLQQHAFRESHAAFSEELVGWGNLPAGDAGQIADQALHFGDFLLFQPLLQLLGRGGHTRLGRFMVSE